MRERLVFVRKQKHENTMSHGTSNTKKARKHEELRKYKQEKLRRPAVQRDFSIKKTEEKLKRNREGSVEEKRRKSLIFSHLI